MKRTYEFTLEELCEFGSLDGLNEAVQERYDAEEGDSAGILSGLDFKVVGVRGEMILMEVNAEVVEID